LTNLHRLCDPAADQTQNALTTFDNKLSRLESKMATVENALMKSPGQPSLDK
jgi:hypothetical protein